MILRIVIAAALIGIAACSNAKSQSDLVPKLQRLGESENAEALYYVGMAYWTGTGTTKDIHKAVGYFAFARSFAIVVALVICSTSVLQWRRRMPLYFSASSSAGANSSVFSTVFAQPP